MLIIGRNCAKKLDAFLKLVEWVYPLTIIHALLFECERNTVTLL